MPLDTTAEETRRLIQRWIGSPQSGDLNDAATVGELLKDVVGLREYLENRVIVHPAVSPMELIAPENPVNLSAGFRTMVHSTPNMGGVIDPKGVVFHHSAGSFAGSLSWIKQARSRVSYHVIVEEDGTRHQVVPLNRRAWHAGVSAFRGRSGCNNFMIGFSFSGSTYERSLTGAEISSAVEFVRDNAGKYGWSYDWMTDHRTVSPGRKNDLNPSEWNRLRNALKSAF